jgi:putative nucleotidyltransferase with HDIG domain
MRLNDDYIRLSIVCLCLVIVYIFILTPLRLNAQGDIFFQNLIARTAYSFFYKNYKEPNIVVIELDDASLDSEHLKWPWPRKRFAELIDKISSLNPSVIALDIAFIGKSGYGAKDDTSLSMAIENTGNVVLASYISQEGKRIEPLDSISVSAKAVGFVNKLQDSRNIIRYARAVTLHDGKFDYSFEAKIAAIYKNVPLDNIAVSNRHLIIGTKNTPLDFDGTYPIKYTYKPKNFQTISVKDIFSDNYAASIIKNKIALFGLTAISLHDIHLTPFGSIPGVIVSANTLANMISGNNLRPLGPAVLFVFYLFLGFIALYAGYKYSKLFSFLIVNIFVFLVYLFAVIMFKQNINVDIFGAISILYMLWVCTKIYGYGKQYFHRIKLLNSLAIDEKTGIYNLYYLLVRMQQYIDSAKNREDNPAIIVFRFQDNAFESVAADEDFKSRAFSYAISVIKDSTIRCNAIIAKVSDLELAVIVSKMAKDRLKSLAETIYTRLNNKEIVYPHKNIKHVISVSAGACHGKDVSRKSARFLLYVAQNMADKASSADGKNIRVYEQQQDSIPFLAEDTKDIADESRLMDFILDDVKRKNTLLQDEIAGLNLKIKKLLGSNFDIILSLVRALEQKDIYTAGHSERVADYSVRMAKKLGLNEGAVETIKRAALLHDIGKISISDELLHKKEGLTRDDRNIIQRHEIESVRILEPVEFLKDTLPLILHHHEHFDGSGYPHGLAGERIPLGARIIVIADSFDAMTSGRGYNKPLSTQEAVAALKKGSGSQFDPGLIDRFIEVISD